MALLDFLKNRKNAQRAKAAEKKALKVSGAQKPDPAEVNASPRPSVSSNKKTGNFSYNVIKEPHISEKATDLAEQNKYTFKVFENSNKMEIKKSVEGIYGVDVLDVRVIQSPGKKRRLGRTEGFKKGFKKAIITIKEGQKIEIF